MTVFPGQGEMVQISTSHNCGGIFATVPLYQPGSPRPMSSVSMMTMLGRGRLDGAGLGGEPHSGRTEGARLVVRPEKAAVSSGSQGRILPRRSATDLLAGPNRSAAC